MKLFLLQLNYSNCILIFQELLFSNDACIHFYEYLSSLFLLSLDKTKTRGDPSRRQPEGSFFLSSVKFNV